MALIYACIYKACMSQPSLKFMSEAEGYPREQLSQH